MRETMAYPNILRNYSSTGIFVVYLPQKGYNPHIFPGYSQKNVNLSQSECINIFPIESAYLHVFLLYRSRSFHFA